MPEPGEYRCAGCGHGDHLSAAAVSYVTGGLLPDGSVVESDSEQDYTITASIECSVHLMPGEGSGLERWVDGAWCRWVPCEWKQLDGAHEPTVCKDGERHRYGKSNGWACPSCEGAGGAWMPIDQTPAETHRSHSGGDA